MQIDVLALVAVVGAAAVDTKTEVGPQAQGFAGVVVTNYLWRPLFPALVAAVAPGGWLIYETFAQGNERFGNGNSVWRRFDRWARKGVWQRVFEVLQDPDLEWLILDSTIIRATRLTMP